MQKLNKAAAAVWSFFKTAYVWLFGAADSPTFLRKTFGKAAEWVVVGVVVVVLLAALGHARHSAPARMVSAAAPLSLCASATEPAKPKAVVKKTKKVASP